METDLKIFDVVDSTNITLAQMADLGAREGTCVVSFCQTAGQGRSGRTFYSPEGGNLYMSLLLRPASDELFNMITTMAAVAVVDAVREQFGIRTGIKWVNDVIRDGRKICGIVARANNYGSRDSYVILGIGVNIYDAVSVPAEIKDRYGSIMGKPCDLSIDEQHEQAIRLCRNIIDDFLIHYESDDPHAHIQKYRQYCIVIGRNIEYLSGDEVIHARVCGIDDEGGIVLDVAGTVKTYRDGEIRIRSLDM